VALASACVAVAWRKQRQWHNQLMALAGRRMAHHQR